MTQCFVCRVRTLNNQLAGYWYLRKQGRFILTFRYVGVQHTKLEFDSADEAVKAFYKSFIQHLLGIRARLIQHVKVTQGYLKPPPGFRNRTWTKQEKETAVARYNSFYREARRDLAREIQRLRERGWPTPAMEQLPWEDDYYGPATDTAARAKRFSAMWALSDKGNSETAGDIAAASAAREEAIQLGAALIPELRLGSIAPVFKIDVR